MKPTQKGTVAGALSPPAAFHQFLLDSLAELFQEERAHQFQYEFSD
jgi:hypothetical protein